MPSTVRRKEMRQCLGANRKVSTIRWIGGQTVGVCRVGRSSETFQPPVNWQVHREKADDGAEKSFRRCKRKRIRGQRRGKRRSREDKSRSSSPRRPKDPKGVNARSINHIGRKFIWGERARSTLVKSKYFRVLERSLPQNVEDDREESVYIEPSWSSHLRRLRRHARKSGIPDGSNPFEKSAMDFVLTNTSLGGEMAFHDILGGLRLGIAPSEYHDLTVKPDEVEELPPSESADQRKKRVEEENLRPGMRGFAPIVRPSTSGIVRPWARRGARNQARSRPYRTT